MKEIAGELNLSVRTIEDHKAVLLRTLGVESTADLIKFAVRQDSFRAEPPGYPVAAPAFPRVPLWFPRCAAPRPLLPSGLSRNRAAAGFDGNSGHWSRRRTLR
jgi:hypothetical protein